MKKKVLVVVAHPDDETVWMGGTLIRNKNNWNTTIISLCRENDSDRAPKFKRVCNILKAKGFISDLEDDELHALDFKEIIKRIRQFADKKYDYIFTHGENGEYEHIRHKEINKVVKEMLKKNLIEYKRIFFFSYHKKDNFCLYNSNADKLIKLNYFEWLNKKKLIQKVYGFSRGGFEEKSCGKIESFNEGI